MTNQDEDYYARLGNLEGHSKILETRIGSVEIAVNRVGDKLDKIAEKMSITKGFDPSAVLTFIKDAAILIGMACAGIIYFASLPGEGDIVNREKMAVLEYKMSVMEKQIGWRATTQ